MSRTFDKVCCCWLVMMVEMVVMMVMVMMVTPTVGHEWRLIVMLDRVWSCRSACFLLLLKKPSFHDRSSAGVAGWRRRRPVIHSTPALGEKRHAHWISFRLFSFGFSLLCCFFLSTFFFFSNNVAVDRWDSFWLIASRSLFNNSLNRYDICLLKMIRWSFFPPPSF